MSSEGNYYRFNLFDERKRYYASLMQAGADGKPQYIVDADFTDWARMTQRLGQRLAQVFVDATVGAEPWKPAFNEIDGDNNFYLTGGSGTDETAAAAWIGGLRATLYEGTDYKCENDGFFNVASADAIHHQYESVSSGTLVDSHANYRPGSLVGLKIQVGGAGEFEVSGNSEISMTLVGFDPDVLTFIHPYYYIVQQPPPVDQLQDVYLDVHLEDWGMNEDPDLNHNAAPGTPVECMRRFKLIQMIWVDQRTEDNPLHPIINFDTRPDGRLTYVDGRGTRHFLFRLGYIARRAAVEGDDGDAIGEDEVVSEHEDEVSPVEVVNARAFDDDCLPIEDDPDNAQPDNLFERLSRGDSVITVGDGDTSHGMFNGVAGLKAAIKCRPCTIFLKRGLYDLSGAGTLVVAVGVRVIGESATNTVILVDASEENVAGVKLLESASLENLTVNRGTGSPDVPAVWLNGPRSSVTGCKIQDLSEVGCAVLFYGASLQEGRLSNCRVLKANKTAIRVSYNGATPPDSQGSVPFAGFAASRAGIYIEGCRVTMTGASLTYPAVHLGAGLGVLFTGNVVSSSGRMLEAGGAYTNDGSSPATFAGRDCHTIHDNLFFAAAGGNDVRLVYLTTANISFQGNMLDVASATSADDLPGYGLTLSTSGAGCGNQRVVNNFIRGCLTGIVVQGAAAQREVLISGNTVVPYITAYGNQHAIELAMTGAGGGSLVVENNYLQAGLGSNDLIRMRCPAVVRGNSLDGSASTLVAGTNGGISPVLIGADPAEAVQSIGIYMWVVGSSTAQCVVEDNRLTGFGSVGIKILASLSTNRMVVARNAVLGQGRTQRGIWCHDALGEVVIEGNEITSTRREGIACPVDTNTLVRGNKLTSTGLDSAVLANNVNPWVHCGIRHGRVIEDNVVTSTGTYGIFSGGHSVTVQRNTVSEAGTISIHAAGTDKFDLDLIVVENTILATRGSSTISVQDAKAAIVERNVIQPGENSKGILCASSSFVRVHGNDIRMQLGSTAEAVDINECSSTWIGHNAIAGGSNPSAVINVDCEFGLELIIQSNFLKKSDGFGVVVSSAGDVCIQDNVIHAGVIADDGLFDARRRSISVTHLGPTGQVRVLNNKADFGVAVNYAEIVSERGPVVQGNVCENLGIQVRSPRANILNNSVIKVATSRKAHAVDASAIWYGYPDWNIDNAIADCASWGHRGVINGNVTSMIGSIGPVDAGIPALSELPSGFSGRCAGMVIRGDLLEVSNNTVLNNVNDTGSIGILMGWLNALAVAAPKVGVRYTSRVNNNRVMGALVVVLATAENPFAYTRVTNNSFEALADSQTVILLFGDTSSFTGYAVVRGNEAARFGGTELDSWGTLQRQDGVVIEVGKTPFEIAATLSDGDALQRSNTLILGANLS